MDLKELMDDCAHPEKRENKELEKIEAYKRASVVTYEDIQREFQIKRRQIDRRFRK